MATKEEALKRLSYIRTGEHVAMALWCREDIHSAAKARELILTDEQADDILDRIDDKQDSSDGISWATIDWFISEYQ